MSPWAPEDEEFWRLRTANIHICESQGVLGLGQTQRDTVVFSSDEVVEIQVLNQQHFLSLSTFMLLKGAADV